MDFKEVKEVVIEVLRYDETMCSVEKVFTKEELPAVKKVIGAAVDKAIENYAIKPLTAEANPKYGTVTHYVIDEDNDMIIEAEASEFDLPKSIPGAKS